MTSKNTRQRSLAEDASTSEPATAIPLAHPPNKLVYTTNYQIAVKKLVRTFDYSECYQYVASEVLDEDAARPGPDALPTHQMPDYQNGLPPTTGISAIRWEDTVTERVAAHPTVQDLLDLNGDDTDAAADVHATRIVLHDIVCEAVAHLRDPAHPDPRMWVLVEVPLTGVLDGWLLNGAADLVLVIADPDVDTSPPHTLTLLILDAKATHNESVAHRLQPATYAQLINRWFAGVDTPLATLANPNTVTWEIETGIVSYDTGVPDDPKAALDRFQTVATPNWESLVTSVRRLLGDDGIVTNVWRQLADHDTDDTESDADDAAPTAVDIPRTMGDHCVGCSLKEACYLDAYWEAGFSLDLLNLDDATQTALEETYGITTVAELAALARGYKTER